MTVEERDGGYANPPPTKMTTATRKPSRCDRAGHTEIGNRCGDVAHRLGRQIHRRAPTHLCRMRTRGQAATDDRHSTLPLDPVTASNRQPDPCQPPSQPSEASEPSEPSEASEPSLAEPLLPSPPGGERLPAVHLRIRGIRLSEASVTRVGVASAGKIRKPRSWTLSSRAGFGSESAAPLLPT